MLCSNHLDYQLIISNSNRTPKQEAIQLTSKDSCYDSDISPDNKQGRCYVEWVIDKVKKRIVCKIHKFKNTKKRITITCELPIVHKHSNMS